MEHCVFTIEGHTSLPSQSTDIMINFSFFAGPLLSNRAIFLQWK